MTDNVNTKNNIVTAKSILKPKSGKKKVKDKGFVNYAINLLLYSLIGISLLAMDFVLFASSGPINIFSSSSLRPEALYILLGIAVGVFGLYFVFSFLTILLSLLTAFIVFLTSIAMFNQFANFSTEALSSGKSEVAFSAILAIVIFCIMLFFKKRYKALVTITAVFCFCVVLINQNIKRPEFVRNETVVGVISPDEAENFISIMMPNAPSYSYITSLKENEANAAYKDQLQAIMLGFYVKNGFRIYPNAYSTNENSFLSAANYLNFETENGNDYLQYQVLKNSYWQFKNLENFDVYLKENKLFDDLKAKGFQINAYQSRGINLCKKSDKNNVSRCVTKINTPVNLDELKLTTWDKTEVLLSQWLESTGWFAYGMKKVYNTLKPIFNPNQTPIIGISYKNLYVINSLDVLDIVAEDISKDQGKNAYFVIFDLPSDLYVYDELCQLKKSDLWLSKVNQPWVESRNNIEKRNMYLRQTMCAFGKLEQFMQKIKESGKLDNATIMLQGLSGMDDMFLAPGNNLADTFRNEHYVAMAIRTPESKRFMVSNSICAVEDIMQAHLEDGKKCEEFNRTNLSKTTKGGLKDAAKKVKFTTDLAQKAVRDYANWYKNWQKLNFQSLSKSSTMLQAASQQPDEPAADLLGMEEKNITDNKVMPGQVQLEPEAEVVPLSEMMVVSEQPKEDKPLNLLEMGNSE